MAAAPSAYPQIPCSSEVDLEEAAVLPLEHLVEEVEVGTLELQVIEGRARQ